MTIDKEKRSSGQVEREMGGMIDLMLLNGDPDQIYFEIIPFS